MLTDNQTKLLRMYISSMPRVTPFMLSSLSILSDDKIISMLKIWLKGRKLLLNAEITELDSLSKDLS